MTESTTAPASTDSSAPLILWVVPFIGVVLVPGLWWTAADAPFAFRPNLMGAMTLAVAVVALATLAIASRGFRQRIRWSLAVAATLVLCGFQWRVFTLAGEFLAGETGIPLVNDIVPVALAGVLLWGTVRFAGTATFAAVFGIVMAAVVTILGLNAFSLVAQPPPQTAAVAPAVDTPSVLLLVLDAYARDDWLEAEYNFDNTPFLQGLEERGFEIAETATANYPYTYAALSTMLNLDYIFAPGEIDGSEWRQMRASLTGATGMIPVFKAAGYEIMYVENAWGGSQCGSAIDWCVSEGLWRRTIWNLGQMSILAPIFRMLAPDPFNDLSADHLESLDEWLAEPTNDDRPRFTFAHILLPHSPLLLNQDCSKDSNSDLGRWEPEDGELLTARRANYVEQIGCVNYRVLEAVDSFLATNPNGIIMITADHGPGSTLDNQLPFEAVDGATIQERMRILSVYRLPGCREEARSDLTPVNGTRLLVNCATGADLEPVPDDNYWSNQAGTRIAEMGSIVRH